MNPLDKNHLEENKQESRVVYEAPAIIYESVITTRAGSPLSINGSDADGVDPADLFGK